jgi:16S rRNA processing protein RimM
MADWDDMVCVGRIVRPHGIRGQVVVAPETDFVEERYRVGAAFCTGPIGEEGRLRIGSVRLQGGRPIVGFEGVTTIEAAERLVGLELRVQEDELMPLADGRYYHHHLVGCEVETTGGERVGQVAGVEGGAGAGLLRVTGARGDVLVPLAGVCVDIDVASRTIRIDPPEGLLELNEPGRKAGAGVSGRRR